MSDVTFAVNERTFKAVFNKIYPSVQLPFDGSTSLGPLWLGVEGQIHIDGAGDIDFEDGNTFLLKELLIGWDQLILRLGFDLPTITIGRFCLLRMPESSPIAPGECIVVFPGATLFSGAPDIGPLKVDLGPIIQYIVTEISGRYSISLAKSGNKLKLNASASAMDVDPISVQDTFGKLPLILQGAVALAVSKTLSVVPQAWMVDMVLGFLGFPTLTTFFLNLLDIEDSAEEWLMDKLNVSIGIDNLIYQAIFNSVAERKGLFEIDDPYSFFDPFKLQSADYGVSPPLPTPQANFPMISAGVLNPEAKFDADYLFIRFDFGV